MKDVKIGQKMTNVEFEPCYKEKIFQNIRRGRIIQIVNNRVIEKDTVTHRMAQFSDSKVTCKNVMFVEI